MPTFNAKVVKYNNDLQGTVIIDGKEYSFDNLVKDEQVEIDVAVAGRMFFQNVFNPLTPPAINA